MACIVLGIDGGGTYTRAAVAGTDGTILGASRKGGSHPGKNEHPAENVKAAVEEALRQAGAVKSDVLFVTAGFAGLNEEKDRRWTEGFLKAAGIQAPSFVVNDAEIARYGAFAARRGILAVAGTGSIVAGKTETGRLVKNYDFHHDSEAGARYLSYGVIYELITEVPQKENEALRQKVLDYWKTETVEELRRLASEGFAASKYEAVQKLSGMGKMVTAEAAAGSVTAAASCRKAANSLVLGIELTAAMFEKKPVPLAFSGGVAKDAYMQQLFREILLSRDKIKEFTFTTPALSPAAGALLYGCLRTGAETESRLIDALQKGENSHCLL